MYGGNSGHGGHGDKRHQDAASSPVPAVRNLSDRRDLRSL
jgi:hypothetical protein